MDIKIPYTPRKHQAYIHKQIDKHRWNVLVCHRRFGKTVAVLNHLIRSALTSKNKNPRYAYISPTFKQSKAIAWDYIKQFTAKIPHTKFNETELRVDLPNGSRITLLGSENSDGLRGIYLDGCVIDEYANVNDKLFPEIIRPALSDRKGYCVFHWYTARYAIITFMNYTNTHKVRMIGFTIKLKLAIRKLSTKRN
jgi:phage terminase large subunit